GVSPNGGALVTRNHIARLNPAGTADTFNPNVGGAANDIYCLALQTDGKGLLGGDFTTVGGQTRNRIARVDSAGALDTGFNPNADSPVMTIALQPDGKLLLGGAFTGLQPNNTPVSVPRTWFARLFNDPATQSLT